jgi:DNA mismatch repair protein MutL
MLLVPTSWDASLSTAPLINENREVLSKMGFVVEPFGQETFLLKGYPSVLGDRFDLEDLLEGLLDVLGGSDDPRAGHEREFRHKLAALAACKAAVKAGDPLSLPSSQTLLNDLVKLDNPLTCPHGRPTVIRFSFSELERRFRRT